jgi:Holliday junction resolvasome RuvABC ATP-dependent DNA helicase subunit
VSTPIRDRFAREYGIKSEYDLEQLQAVLDEHAHQLAEEIRNSEQLRDATDDHMSDCNMAADLIDPGAQW